MWCLWQMTNNNNNNNYNINNYNSDDDNNKDLLKYMKNHKKVGKETALVIVGVTTAKELLPTPVV